MKKDFVGLDIETTGLNPKKNEIIEIACCLFEDGVQTSTLSYVIRPTKRVSPFIMQLTGLGEVDFESGVSLEKALKTMVDFVDEKPLVCHNCQFDINFINTKLLQCGKPILQNRVFDTLQISRIFMPNSPNHKLVDLCQNFGISITNLHRATDDAQACSLLFLKLIDFIDDCIPTDILVQSEVLARIAETEDDLEFFLNQIIRKRMKNPLEKRKSPNFDDDNYVEYKAKSNHHPTVEDIFGEEGILKTTLDHFEYREAQKKMALAVEGALVEKKLLLCEAGTGCGKSLSYLLPGILHTIESGEKLIVSTNTKNLQAQLFYKDIPAVCSVFPKTFRVLLIKGRENYICNKKWEEIFLKTGELNKYDARHLLNLIVWFRFTKSGDISSNNSFYKKSFLWKKVNADRFSCLGKQCQFYYDGCFFFKTRRKIAKTNLIISNHSLVLAELANLTKNFDSIENLVLDEAHNLHDSALSSFTISLSFYDLNSLLQNFRNVKQSFFKTFKNALKNSAIPKNLKSQITTKVNKLAVRPKLLKELEETFSLLGKQFEKSKNFSKFRISPNTPFPFEQMEKLGDLLKDRMATIGALQESFGLVERNWIQSYDIYTERIKRLELQFFEVYEKVVVFIKPDFLKAAIWLLEIGKTKEPHNSFCINHTPLEVGNLLYETIYKNFDTTILTSATLSIREDFRYFEKVVGINFVEQDLVQRAIFPSPFDYKTQTLVQIAQFLPEPVSFGFREAATDLIGKIVEKNNIGTMLLFTSYKDMEFVYNKLSTTFYENNIPAFIQGKNISRNSVLREFKKHPNSILFGTNSFWEGVDIPGVALSILILFKLPFQVPNDPIVEALLQKMQHQKENSFLGYILPNSLLKYKQGFGRLIRHKNDRGVVVVLDSRICTKRYGRFFQQVLPTESHFAKDQKVLLEQIEMFFGNKD